MNIGQMLHHYAPKGVVPPIIDDIPEVKPTNSDPKNSGPKAGYLQVRKAMKDQPKMTAKTLAAKLKVTAPHINWVMRDFEKKGFVKEGGKTMGHRGGKPQFFWTWIGK
jgi:hypothetical protein